MKYQRIFWLEDAPDILGDVLRICAGRGVDRSSLFSRITFAPDYETGAQIVQNKDFDLFILDGDFPEATSKEWKNSYWSFMEQVSSDTKHLDFPRYLKDKRGDKYREGYIGRSTNNFSIFFDQFLCRKAGRTVIYSISTIAPTLAFHYGLPLYSKALGKKMITNVVTENLSYDGFLSRYVPNHIIPKSCDYLEEWECGSRFEFVERYLL